MAVLAMLFSPRDPDFRAALSSLKALLSVKVMMLTTVNVLALMMFIQFTRRYWRSSWTFEVTDEHLIAAHQFTGARHTIPWASITSVDKVRPVFLAWGAPRQFSRIVLDDGTELLFAHHLSRYPEFIEELRKRVTCRVFNPHEPTLW
jgi:hypothetical protein